MELTQKKIYTTEDIYALPEGQRAELIDGQMYMTAPPRAVHQRISYATARKISNYIDHKKAIAKYSSPHSPYSSTQTIKPM